MNPTDPTPEEIQAVIEAGFPIPYGTVKQWMKSLDIEVLGAVYDLLTTASASQRIEPPFPFREFPTFILSYFERCLRERPDSDWAHNPAEAGMALVGYYRHIWVQQAIREQEFAGLKQWLEKLCREDDPEFRTRVVQSVLEHLLEDAEIATYFSDWQHDPTLHQAYAEAMEWAIDHPRQPRRA